MASYLPDFARDFFVEEAFFLTFGGGSGGTCAFVAVRAAACFAGTLFAGTGSGSAASFGWYRLTPRGFNGLMALGG